ncbi:MAG: aminotransferase [Desulfitobacteriaceae bacterium]|nr:aminotransferase [Desulfitobacteriaceae bacterium]
MLDLSIVIQKIDKRAKLPEYATPKDAGMDVFACPYDGNPEDSGKTVDEVLIFPGETKLICLGFRVGLPDGWFLDVRPRSGISLNTPLRIANAPGTIDTDYKGIMFALIHNSSPTTMSEPPVFRCNEKHNYPGIYSIKTGDKICQLVPQKHYKAEIIEGNVYSVGGDRGGGIGHTEV